MTIVLTTHYLDEADSMAERVMVIDHGVVIADDTADRLKAQLAGDRIVLVTDGDASAGRVVDIAGRVAQPQEVDVDAGTVSLRVVEAAGTLPGLLRALDADGVAVQAAEVRRPTLDDVFLTLTGRSLREDVAA
jgi:ABC-2 type transport system ATP-binding protein